MPTLDTRTPETALDKRIKRQVTAQEHRFFTVVSPGLVQVCHDELTRLFNGDKDIREMDGGLEFKGTVADCYRANLHVRTASRIIMRIGEFTARDFSTLEKKSAEFPWELYIAKNTVPDIHVTVKKSKLYHSDAVAQRIRDSISKRTGALTGDGETCASDSHGVQMIFIRAIHDLFEISIDSSGALLYMRGLKTTGTRAPLRETLAAGLLLAAGYDGVMPLIDPMCGSGSFSLEAALMARHIPPGWYRDFAFQHWPCFREGIWKHIRRTAETQIILDSPPAIFASDQDQTACDRLHACITDAGFSDTIQVTHHDFFDIDPKRLCAPKGLVIVNPPYGLRLGTRKDSIILITNLFKTFQSRYRGWHVAVLSPYEKPMVHAPQSMKQQPMFHGGLKLFLIHGKIRR